MKRIISAVLVACAVSAASLSSAASAKETYQILLGETWSYGSCWKGVSAKTKARLQINRKGKWVTVAVTRPVRDRAVCPGKEWWAVKYSYMPSAAGMYDVREAVRGAMVYLELQVANPPRPDAVPIYRVGSAGPAGGVIVSVANPRYPFPCGKGLRSRCTYLEAAPANWYNSAGDPGRTWSAAENHSKSVSGGSVLGTVMGTGYSNSLAIVAQAGNNMSNSAAALALSYRGGGQSDWYLPSRVEMSMVQFYAVLVGGLEPNNYYWTSTEVSTCCVVVAAGGYMSDSNEFGNKSLTRYVRPVRAF